MAKAKADTQSIFSKAPFSNEEHEGKPAVVRNTGQERIVYNEARMRSDNHFEARCVETGNTVNDVIDELKKAGYFGF